MFDRCVFFEGFQEVFACEQGKKGLFRVYKGL